MAAGCPCPGGSDRLYLHSSDCLFEPFKLCSRGKSYEAGRRAISCCVAVVLLLDLLCDGTAVVLAREAVRKLKENRLLAPGDAFFCAEVFIFIFDLLSIDGSCMTLTFWSGEGGPPYARHGFGPQHEYIGFERVGMVTC